MDTRDGMLYDPVDPDFPEDFEDQLIDAEQGPMHFHCSGGSPKDAAKVRERLRKAVKKIERKQTTHGRKAE